VEYVLDKLFPAFGQVALSNRFPVQMIKLIAGE
jgi:hypothetical protein